MAKKQTSKTSAKKQNKETNILNVTGEIGRKELFAFSSGLILFVVSVFLIIAFTSYLYSGRADFDILENPQVSDIFNENSEVKNVCGSIGAWVAYTFLNNFFGLASYGFPVFFILLGMRLMNVYKVKIVRIFILMSLLIIWLSVALSAFSTYIPGIEESFINPGGNHGQFVVKWLTTLVGAPGLYGILFLFAIFYLVYVSKRTVDFVRSMFRLRGMGKVRDYAGKLMPKRKHTDEDGDDDEESAEEGDGEDAYSANSVPERNPEDFEDPTSQVVVFAGDNSDEARDKALETEQLDDDNRGGDVEIAAADDDANNKGDEMETRQTGADNGGGFIIDIGGGDDAGVPEDAHDDAERGNLDSVYDPKLDLEFYKYPTLDLLEHSADSMPQIDMAEQNANKDRITKVLRSFGVEINTIKATIGPTVTLYEITPAEGTRINKIRNLEDDIALSLAAEGIRIIAPIPGKGTIGIEVPNKKKCVVSMESILNSRTYQTTQMELPCALGKTIMNEVFMIDLAKAPHLLVAGATGMGKSVGLNAIVTSLLYKKHPSELKIVMVDPKKVEFSIYSPIENHFLAKLEDEEEAIITDVQKVVKTLNSLCVLMDTRYDMLKKAKCRNIKEYNAKFKERRLNPEDGHEFMPYVVVIIDEFGDLIMTAGKEIELPICRIAQLARAVGIHMIIATQRPTASIITGTIKANFPARISFRVSAMMDSRIILDRPGANQLIGKGDMLYHQGGDPVRVQCAFVDTPEVSRICSFIAEQQSPLHAMYLPEPPMEDNGGAMGENTADMKHLDPMFAEVAKLIVSTQQGSTSLIQRKFSIGYNRAGRLMDQLEKAGVVGPVNGAKPREVLITDLLTLDSLLNTIG